MFRPKSIGFILNPVAGRRRVERWESDIRRSLESIDLPHELIRTSRPAEAGEIAGDLVQRHDLVAAVGGDGTAHEVAQGIAGTSSVLGLVPQGSGNDFNRFLQMPSDAPSAARTLARDSVVESADAAYVTVRSSVSRIELHRWMINTLGIGYDAAVAFRRERVPMLRGLPLYLTSALWTLIDARPQDFDVQLDDEAPRGLEGFMVCLGIGKFEGGGFKVLPDARQDDGLVDICEVKSMAKLRLLPLLIKAISGGHVTSPGVRMGLLRTARISSQKPFPVHADGELLCKEATEVILEIKSSALRVARPAFGV
jgi:YegS/Rv2252/BmrU family lipid kinase